MFAFLWSGERPLEYGLIAEEVAVVFPDLVVYDEDGKPFTVKYHLLSSMLLNELEKMNARLAARDEAHALELSNHAGELEELRSRLTAVETRVCLSQQEPLAELK